MKDFVNIVKQSALNTIISKGYSNDQAVKLYDTLMNKVAVITTGTGPDKDIMQSLKIKQPKGIVTDSPGPSNITSPGGYSSKSVEIAKPIKPVQPTLTAPKLAMAIKFATTGATAPGGATAPTGAPKPVAGGAQAPTAPTTGFNAKTMSIPNLPQVTPPVQPDAKKAPAAQAAPVIGSGVPNAMTGMVAKVGEYQYDLCKAAALIAMAKHGIPPTMGMTMFNKQLDKYEKELTKENTNEGSTV